MNNEIFKASKPFYSFIEVDDNKIKQIKFQKLKDKENLFFGLKDIEIDRNIFILTGRNGSCKTKFLEILKKNCERQKMSLLFNLHQFDNNFKSFSHKDFIFDKSFIFYMENFEQIKTLMKKNPNEPLDINVENLLNKELEKVSRVEDENEKLLYKIFLAFYFQMVKKYINISSEVPDNPLNAIGSLENMLNGVKSLFLEQDFAQDVIPFLRKKSEHKEYISKLEQERNQSLLDNNKINCDKEIKRILIKEWIEKSEKLTSPLEFINKDLENFSLKLFFTNDKKIEIRKKRLGENLYEKIEPSSGELFIINIYAMKYINTKFLPVNIILLDEPDRHLEPKLIEIFFGVLKELSNLGIQIFMTTHRPDTISLADPDTIWTIDYDKQTHTRQIKKCHKYSALFKLTYNLRDIMNFKIKVYVESHTDFRFYEIMYGILLNYSNEIRKHNSNLDRFKPLGFNFNRILSRRYQLEFCSSAKNLNGGQGGKNALLDFLKRELSSIDFQIQESKKVNLNRNLELFKPYGLRDKDDGLEKNFDREFTNNSDLKNRILSTKRYSLENFLYDPILICSFGQAFLEENNLTCLLSIKNSIDQNLDPNYDPLINDLTKFKDIENKIQEKITKQELEKIDEITENYYIHKFKDTKPVKIKYPKILRILKGHLIEKALEDIYSNNLISKIECEISKSKLEINDSLFILYKYALSLEKCDINTKLQTLFDEIFKNIIKNILKNYPEIIFKKSDFFRDINMNSVIELVSNDLKLNLDNKQTKFYFPKDFNFNIMENNDLEILCKKFILKKDVNFDDKNIFFDALVISILNDRMETDQSQVKYPKILQYLRENHKTKISRNVIKDFQFSSSNDLTLGDKIMNKLNEMLQDQDGSFYFPLDLAETFFELNEKVRKQITDIIKKPLNQ